MFYFHFGVVIYHLHLVLLLGPHLSTADKFDALDTKWDKYLQKVKSAVDNYDQCKLDYTGCSDCHNRQMKQDLGPWKKGITQKQLAIADKDNKSLTKYQIINHKLYRSRKCVFEARCQAIEWYIYQLLKELPDMDLRINCFDQPSAFKVRWQQDEKPPVLSFSKNHVYDDIMYPAWSFHSGGPAVWPIFPTGQGDWNGTREWLSSIAKKTPWRSKKPKGFFIGSRTSSERDPLILLSRAKPDLVEAAYTKNQAYKGPKDLLNAEPAEPKNYDEHCPYKYLFNFRGVAASFRFKHLFLCESLVFHVADEGEDWLEFFYQAMKPWVHYIPVSTSLREIEELLQFVKENDEVAHQIAMRGAQFIQDHLRPKDVMCYWRRLLLHYAQLQRFKPELDPALILIEKPKGL